MRVVRERKALGIVNYSFSNLLIAAYTGKSSVKTDERQRGKRKKQQINRKNIT